MRTMKPVAGKSLESEKLLEIYGRLLSHFGPRNWWPGDSPFEIMIGAILTQNTSWSNVEKAISNLNSEGVLAPERMLKLDIRKLRRLIRPSGYYNEKAKKLKNFLRFYCREPVKASHERMSLMPLEELREKLLSVNGIGPETADSILLYALGKPVFVVDAYTRRIFHRMDLCAENAGYYELQDLFTRNLPEDVELYNDYHAQIVALGNTFCRKKPKCDLCPVEDMCVKSGNIF